MDVAQRVDAGELHTSKANTMIRAFSLALDITRLALEQAEVDIKQRALELDIEERQVLKQEVKELKEMVESKDELRWNNAR